ncbi:TonB-dependent siderophore receptor [Aliarcobacter butzleri]|uniref:TonB-dependent siderophore receptor n=1 Tax=Aliarcobacter butzleri TaxID=28197 RepID=UPI003AEDA352
MKRKSILVAPVLAILLNTSLNAEQFSISNLSLKQAIEEISKKSNMPYMVDGKLLDGKKAPNIKNIEGVENALNEILKDTNLKATIEDGTILIREKAIGLGTVLEPISVNDSYLGSTTENSNSYTTGSMNTATKLDLSIRETPQTSIVFTRQYLDDLNITSGQALLSKIPGVSLDRTDERLDPSTRGFSVNYYLFDGIPTYSSSAIDPDLILYDRVEIIKGANGLMTGAGNPGMGLNYIRKHANSKVFVGNLNLSGGSWDKYSASMDIMTPLNNDGTIRARFIAKHQDNKSFLDFYKKTNDTFYGVVDMDLTDTTYLSLGTSYEDIKRDGIRWGGLPAFYTDGSQTNFNRSKNFSDDWTYWDNKTTNYFVDFKQYIYNDISLNLSYLNREIKTDNSMVFLLGKVDKNTKNIVGDYMSWESESKAKEHNIDLYTSIPFEIAKLDQEIILGVSYNNSKVTEKVAEDYLSASSINFNNISIPKPIYSNFDIYSPNKTIQKAYYLTGKISLLEDLKLISGIRVSFWEYKSDDGEGNRKFNNEITPYTGLVYDINDNHSAYISYTSIFQPTTNVDEQDNYLDPIVGKSYEVGIKGEYFNGYLNTYLSLFRIEQTGFENTGIKTPKGNDVSKRIDGVVSKGFEIGASGNITDTFSLDFGLTNFEAKNPDGTDFETKNSRTTANIWSKYTYNDYRYGTGLNYKSKFYKKGATVNQDIIQDGFVTVDLMAGYKINKNFDIQLNINNLFDKKYYEGIGDFIMNYGEPRSFAVNMKYSF